VNICLQLFIVEQKIKFNIGMAEDCINIVDCCFVLYCSTVVDSMIALMCTCVSQIRQYTTMSCCCGRESTLLHPVVFPHRTQWCLAVWNSQDGL